MRKRYIFLLAFIGLTLQSSAQKQQEIEDGTQCCETISISMEQLISTPEKYHEKEIIVTGFMNLQFEGTALYMHCEDYVYSSYRNGIWLDYFESAIMEDLSSLNQEYVNIKGVFDMNMGGHFGLWSGTLKNITAITPRNSSEAKDSVNNSQDCGGKPISRSENHFIMLKMGDLSLEIEQSTFDYVKDDWIKVMVIIERGKESIERYGNKGKNGVLLLELKSDSLSLMLLEKQQNKIWLLK